MSRLSSAPPSFLDSRGEPAYGAYEGPLPRVEFPRLGWGGRLARRKKWVYVAFVGGDVWVSICILRTGYAATLFAFAYDLVTGQMLVDETSIGPSLACRVSDDAHVEGELAAFRWSGAVASMNRTASSVQVKLAMKELTVEATVDESSGPPAIAAIGAVGEGAIDATEKRGPLDLRGFARCAGRDVTLDGGVAGYDYTHGLMPRRTTWRWGFALGKTTSGESFALNVVQGFMGEKECAVFLGDRVLAISEPRFTFDLARPCDPWRLEADGLDLTFAPGAMHTQNTNLVLVRSRFVQPVGTFSGTLRVDGRDVVLEGVPGVVEDQDTIW
ncbi:MAG: DUF2804 family protein [Deltaproteobacteria bacterium]|nr:DUF2804 family protein [Deltaproteobacteria bacterium]